MSDQTRYVIQWSLPNADPAVWHDERVEGEFWSHILACAEAMQRAERQRSLAFRVVRRVITDTVVEDYSHATVTSEGEG